MELVALAPLHFSNTQWPSDQNAGKINLRICLLFFYLFRCRRSTWLLWALRYPRHRLTFLGFPSRKNNRSPGKNWPVPVWSLHLCQQAETHVKGSSGCDSPQAWQGNRDKYLVPKLSATAVNKSHQQQKLCQHLAILFFLLPVIKD